MNKLLSMNLQLFRNKTEYTAEDFTLIREKNDETLNSNKKSFNDVLKDKEYQAEFDRRVAKALETAKLKWMRDYEIRFKEDKIKLEEIAFINEREKVKYEYEKRLSQLNEREKDITFRELKVQAYEALSEKNLPNELIEVINFESAELCKKSIETLDKIFKQSLEECINDKLRGRKLPRGGLKYDKNVLL